MERPLTGGEQIITELRERGLSPRRPDRTKATMDHSTPTLPAAADGTLPYASAASEAQVAMLARNCAEHGIELFDMQSANRGIVHQRDQLAGQPDRRGRLDRVDPLTRDLQPAPPPSWASCRPTPAPRM